MYEGKERTHNSDCETTNDAPSYEHADMNCSGLDDTTKQGNDRANSNSLPTS
jgi:hypothetical protein